MILISLVAGILVAPSVSCDLFLSGIEAEILRVPAFTK